MKEAHIQCIFEVKTCINSVNNDLEIIVLNNKDNEQFHNNKKHVFKIYNFTPIVDRKKSYIKFQSKKNLDYLTT